MGNGCNIYGPQSEKGISCCNVHDKHYRQGDISKGEADLKLYRCVKAAGHPVAAIVMYTALKAMGWVSWNKYRLRDKFGWFAKK